MTNVQYQQTAEHGILHRPVSQFLDVEHHIHSSFEKSIIIERTIQYIKDRTEGFDDCFPCEKKKCKLKHVINWFNLFIDKHNKEIIC